MKHRTPGSLIAMNQGISRTGGGSRDPQPACDRLYEGRLARAKISFEREQLARPELAAQGLAFGFELRFRESRTHACRRILPVGRRTSGAAAAFSSFSWSRSMAASSNSRLAA